MHEGFDRDVVQLPPVAPGVHVLFEVLVHVLEHQHEFVLRVDDIVQGDDVFVFELFHQRDLADRRRGRAFFGVEVDLFERDEFAGLAVAPFEDLNGQSVAPRAAGLRGSRYRRISAFTELGPLAGRPGGGVARGLPSPAAGTSWGGACPFPPMWQDDGTAVSGYGRRE